MNIKKKIRHAIRWFMPYGMVLKYQHRHTKENVDLETQKSFVLGFRNYINNKERVKFIEQSPFKTIVSVQGFGYSGSGAIVDLLREYESTIVVGNIDKEGSIASENMRSAEVDILRLAGGLFEVEKFLGSNNIFQNDALLHRVMDLIECSEIYQKLSKTRPYFFEYMNQICEFLTNTTPQYQMFNLHLDYKDKNDIFCLKFISISKYRNICCSLLNTLFSIIRGDSNASILVLDQLVGDVEFDTRRYKEYIPNLKMITVYRDPRDVYAFANFENVGWIPHDSVEDFVKWYDILTKNYNLNEERDYIVVQFEKLITNYEDVVSVIEKFVGLTNGLHVSKFSCLDPAMSSKNIYIWKRDTSSTFVYEKIYRLLKPYCYNY